MRQAAPLEIRFALDAQRARRPSDRQDDGPGVMRSVIGDHAPVAAVGCQTGHLGDAEFGAGGNRRLQQPGRQIGARRGTLHVLQRAEIHQFAAAAHAVQEQAGQAGARHRFRRAEPGGAAADHHHIPDRHADHPPGCTEPNTSAGSLPARRRSPRRTVIPRRSK